MRHKQSFLRIGLILSLLLVPAVSAQETPMPDALWEAAKAGDLDEIRRLLDAGVDANAPTRYGATAITFAAEKGHIEVVELLIERGAEVNVRDTFYEQTPTMWALIGQHRDVVELLLQNGSKDYVELLTYGLRLVDRDLIRWSLAAGPLTEWEYNAAQDLAKNANDPEIEAMVAAAEKVENFEPAELTAEKLSGYVGLYRIANGKKEMRVDYRDEALFLSIEDDEPKRLLAVDEARFRVEGDLDTGLNFVGRGDMVETVVFSNRALDSTYEPFDPTAPAPPPPKRRPLFAPKEDAAAPAKIAAAPRKEAKNWPQFRGVEAAGRADGQGAVVHWDAETGENVLWKTPIPGLGLSSPIVWGDRVYLTTAISGAGENDLTTGFSGTFEAVDDSSEHVWQLIALDAKSGEIVWTREAGRAVPKTSRHLKASQANSTPVTDGEHVVVIFPTIGLFCYDQDGELLWKRDLGVLDAGWFYDKSYQWGFASSPVLYDGTVIVQADVQEGAFIAAYDLKTGEERWRTERDEIPTWATPTLLTHRDRHELIANGTTIRGYDPKTGEELWRLAPNSEVIIATPILHEDLIYVSAGYPPVRAIYAVKAGAKGDISLPENETSNDSIAWSYDRGGAYMPTPIVYGDIFYIGHHNNRIEAYEAATGERIYRARFTKGGTFTGSPVAADGRLYFNTEEGLVYVVEAGRKYKELAVHDMGEAILTTPAISDGAFFLRTAKHLWALGETAPSATEDLHEGSNQ